MSLTYVHEAYGLYGTYLWNHNILAPIVKHLTYTRIQFQEYFGPTCTTYGAFLFEARWMERLEEGVGIIFKYRDRTLLRVKFLKSPILRHFETIGLIHEIAIQKI